MTATPPAPSTAWTEHVQPDEAARHERQAQDLVALQREKNARYGNGRALHRKQHVGLKATLRVHEGLPAHASHGLFARGGAAYEAWLRVSNGGTDKRGDRVPDIRGNALRVQGVSGESALGGPATHQDFLMINPPAFAFADSKPFVGLVQAVSSGPLAVIGWARRTYGWGGLFGALKEMKAKIGKPFTGYATEPVHTALPLACGPYAVRVRMLPPASEKPAADAGADYRADLVKRVKDHALVYRLQLQFFVDEQRTPIENASVDWPQDVAPWLDVADVVVEKQDPDSAEGQAFSSRVEEASFDPWQALAAHRPLGEVMRARKVAYFASQKARAAKE